MAETKFIVFTGGPGAGKTAILDTVKKTQKQQVAIMPESASILFQGGFWRLESSSAKISAQRAIYYVQQEMERLVRGEGQYIWGLCDRGSLDALAYWPEREESFWKQFQTSKEREFEKYHSIIHLRCPTDNMGYNHQNPVRIETAEEALKIDERIHKIWRDHKNYQIIPSNTSFLKKVAEAHALLKHLAPGIFP